MKVAIFGGSFDPVHIGHINIVKKALKELDIDQLIIMPTYLNPFKNSFSAPPELRLKWLKKIFLTQKKVKVSDFEVKRGKTTFAIESVKYIKTKFKPKKIYFIVGSDNLASLNRWKEYKRLKKEVEFIVITRPNFRYKSKFKTIRLNIDISSTMLRQKPLQRFLPKIVARDIKRFYL